jgi:hypothetical protein
VSEPKQYRIASIDDFRTVPLDRLEDCLVDFRYCLEDAAMVEHKAHELAKADGVTIPPRACAMPGFIWIDDGKRNIDLQILKSKGQKT